VLLMILPLFISLAIVSPLPPFRLSPDYFHAAFILLTRCLSFSFFLLTLYAATIFSCHA